MGLCDGILLVTESLNDQAAAAAFRSLVSYTSLTAATPSPPSQTRCVESTEVFINSWLDLTPRATTNTYAPTAP